MGITTDCVVQLVIKFLHFCKLEKETEWVSVASVLGEYQVQAHKSTNPFATIDLEASTTKNFFVIWNQDQYD